MASIPNANSASSAPEQRPALPCAGFLRQPEVLRLIPFSKSTLWRHVQARRFPQPVHLSQRVTAWRVEEVRQWIENKATPS